MDGKDVPPYIIIFQNLFSEEAQAILSAYTYNDQCT